MGILSETLFLFLTLAALHFHATRLAADPVRARDALAFGALLGLAYLTRTAATALVAAYVLHAAIRALSRRSAPRWPLALPLLPLAVMAALWIAFRPSYQGVTYGLVLGPILDALRNDPLHVAVFGATGLGLGWIASFASESDVHIVTRCVFLAVGALGICGAVMRARRNALDGWYALASLAMLWAWFLGEDTMRRLLYPLVPVLLAHAVLFARYLASRMRPGPAARLLPFALLLPPALLALPAIMLIHSKSLERSPVIAGFPYSFAGTTDFYTTIAVQRSRAVAARNIAVLTGLQALQSDTPPGARVMWVRPDYVALLGDRQGIPWHFRGGVRGLAEEVRRSGAQYLIVSALYKANIHGERLDPMEGLEAMPPFLRAAALTRNPVIGTNDFALMRVDREALDAYLAGR
jgi:cell shape-determining protein MreD